jgi:hypothetical protein
VKILVLSLVALIIGVAAGVYTSYREFDGERVPTKNVLALLDEKESEIGTTDGPKVVVEGGEIHDFGTQDRGSKGKHPFLLKNVGNKPLVMELLETTCKCTVPAIDGKPLAKGDKLTIEPGKTFPLTLEWAIKTASENFSQSAEFKTNDPRRDVVKLLIHGKTVESVELGEGAIDFAGISANEPAVEELALYSHREQELKITKFAWENSAAKEFLDVNISPLPATEVHERGARGGVAVRVSLKPGLPLGVTKHQLILTTNYEGIEPQVVPVNIRIVGDISLLGPRVRSINNSVALESIDQKAGMTHTVYLHVKGPHRDTTNIEIERIEPSSLQATLGAPLGDSPAVKVIPLKIEVPVGAPLGNFLGTDNSVTGRIILKTTHPDIKQMIIPVLFVVR